MPLRQKLFWVSCFTVAMAYLESAVVVYLRMIYYPQGFEFPLAPAVSSVIWLELGREAATIIMLTAIGFFCGGSKLERFAYLLLSFGIWDIMYYVWLKIFIGWPESLFTWDILFLIPVPWVGPVLAPLLVSLTMVATALWIIHRESRGTRLGFSRWAWWGEIMAGLVIILSFIWDAQNITGGGLPRPFRWEIFTFGWLAGFGLFIWQMIRPFPNWQQRNI